MKHEYEKYEPFFGTWKIKREIGSGSYGKVYEVERKEMGITYKSAIKIISLPITEKKVVKNVVQEIELMSKLKGNSHIVSYEDHQIIEHENGCDILIRMELLIPLKEYINNHVFTERDALKMGIDVCKALDLCEKKNIIHRDIKPENIFISENGDYKLGDFGIAKVTEQSVLEKNQKGTYAYMAPEVYKGEKYGAVVDIYSLGLVLYRIFNNDRMPFYPKYPEHITYGDKENALKKRILGEKLVVPENADSEMARILLKVCAYEQNERYCYATELQKELERKIKSADNENDLLKVYKNPEQKRQESDEERTLPEGNSISFSINEKLEELTVKETGAGEEPGVIEGILARDNGTKKSKKKIWIIVVILLMSAAIGGGIWTYCNWKFKVPDLSELSEKEAEQKIEEAGLFAKMIYIYSDKVEKGYVISQSIKEGTEVKRKTEIQVTISKGIEMIKVPDFTGFLQKEAEKQAKEQGLVLEISEEYSDEIEAGIVISQDKEADTEVEKGSKIRIIVSKGVKMVKVPDFTGKSQSEVVNECNNLGITVSFIWEYSNEQEQGYAIKQDTAPSTEIKVGNALMVTLSKGKEEKAISESKPQKGNSSSVVQPSAPPAVPSAPAAEPNQQPKDTEAPVDTEQQEQEMLEDILNDME